MENLHILLTLMRDSRKIEVNVRKIISFKAITLGSGSIISLIEPLNGSEFLIVDESVAEIDELMANKVYLPKRNYVDKGVRSREKSNASE